ncbi:TerB family tellurite resistance protein [Aggregatimonas sangjinii]|uniref:TerB family tellurite resistance protein n=1 Tax=Aggregatimonas sangjinii TaxID=2583587 RepID=A0A5B7SXJ6_9FLAO|nr:TerB family tellurite resistance protein [Aggregatimonas sangjinii]QCX01430.1 TerB family tellurite resistance protein [Aggregatimonas sangjinii]
MDFTLAEKLAIVKAVDAIVIADGVVHNGEIDHVQQLMHTIDFDSNFIVQARNIPAGHDIKILKEMPDNKKTDLARILKEVANSDGFVHKKETALMSQIFAAIEFI